MHRTLNRCISLLSRNDVTKISTEQQNQLKNLSPNTIILLLQHAAKTA